MADIARKLSREEVLEIMRVAREKEERPDLTGADLSEVNLSGANLSGADLNEADLSWADLSEADLSWAKLSNADLRGAELSGADLNGADLSWAKLSWAELRGTDLSWAKLSGADLSEVNLSGANLSGANLSGADLSGADLSWADVWRTIFAEVDLSEVKGLETVQHSGASSIGVDTLFRSKGHIPEVFLRGAGVPEILITYLPSMLGQAIQYYSCFISYASKDSPFAKRLHADLQQEGVRCWFAPEDLKIGERIRVGIDQSIRVHDKLLLILSEHSLASDWVEQEVEAAMEQERQRKETVLFPVRLDEAVMRSELGWAAHIKRSRNIGDFRKWRGHKSYQQAFQRLLRDLKVKDD